MTIKEKIFSKDKLTVVLQGDSHFWGQGAHGWKEAMPDVKAGDLRRLPSSVPALAPMLEEQLVRIRGPRKETTVINSAVGSTPVTRYYTEYFTDMVKAHEPDIVVMQHAINDWIADRNVSVEVYREYLVKMTGELFDIGADVVMATQSPILGPQYSGSHYYGDYIETFRSVALGDARIKLADANSNMRRFLSDGDFERNAQWLFADRWHCSQAGFFMYLKAVTDAMGI